MREYQAVCHIIHAHAFRLGVFRVSASRGPVFLMGVSRGPASRGPVFLMAASHDPVFQDPAFLTAAIRVKNNKTAIYLIAVLFNLFISFKQRSNLINRWKIGKKSLGCQR